MEIQEINSIQEYIRKVLKETGEEWDNRSTAPSNYILPSIIGRLRGSLEVVDMNLEALKRNLRE